MLGGLVFELSGLATGIGSVTFGLDRSDVAGATAHDKRAGRNQDHALELGQLLGAVDTDRGAKVSGARFYFLTGVGARLELALLMAAVDRAVAAGFAPMITPTLVKPEIMAGTGFLGEHADEVYHLDGDDLYLDCVTEPVAADVISHYQATIVDPLVTASASAPVVTIVGIEFLDPDDVTDPFDDSFDTACHFTAGGRTQRITIETEVNGKVRRLSVVKRPAAAPTTNLGAPPTTAGGGNLTSPPTPGL